MAIVPVHLYGRPADPSARPYRLVVVEDAAQAHGAIVEPVGHAVTYSFYPTKNIGGIGDGGAVATADPDLAAAIRRRRVHGMTEQYVHVEVSQNFRMSELEAAWLRLQLPSLGADNARRAAIARHYRSAAPAPTWQADHPHHVFHLCVARFTDRDAARAQLGSAGVATAVHYPLAHHPAAGLPLLRRSAVPGGRAVGGRMRERAVLPRADRRRGRDRGRRPGRLPA